MRTPLLSGLIALVAATAPAAERRPNILLIVSDDQGYADLGCYGGSDIPTPNIDSIAKNGVRCSSGYVSGPYCSPTRAGLLTGRYQTRFGHEFNPGPPATTPATVGLPLTETTLPDRLKAAGYATGMVGKWHLGHAPPFHPLKRGFEEFYGFLGGAHSYVDLQRDQANRILRGTEPLDEKAYLTDAFGREAVAYIDRHKGGEKPWFLYWTFNAVHTPMQATDKYLSRFANIKDEKRRTYAAMTSAMDDAVGLVLSKLRDSGLEENTLIFYVSDNGGPPVNASSNGKLRGHKAQTLEGGIRVPWMAQWKGHLPAGATYDKPVIQLDMVATSLVAAGVTPTPDMKLDGVDLMPYLMRKNTASPHEALYWRFGDQTAIRKGDWKLVRHREGKGLELYNLATDIGELKDLAMAEPAKVQELKADWDKWNGELEKPRWQAPNQQRRQQRQNRQPVKP